MNSIITPPTVTLFSETDIHGTIIFVNDEFCKTAKYTREELIGKSHNIIRHPDMPKKFFEIFWDTIKAGKVFRGIIKNRAQDSTHYWVQAIIMPILDNNKNVIRYIGARHLVTDDQLAQELYDHQAREMAL